MIAAPLMLAAVQHGKVVIIMKDVVVPARIVQREWAGTFNIFLVDTS